MNKTKKFTWKQLLCTILVLLAAAGAGVLGVHESAAPPELSIYEPDAYVGQPYVAIEDNVPDFPASDLHSTEPFEEYGPLDSLDRCTAAYANICLELMPTEERGSIGHIHPSGWQSVRYDFVDGKSLYNRCHLIGFQLAGENDNERNLVTGTRYMNVQGMLPFENMIADFVKETGYHVLYRVTPVFDGKNLVCSGVRMEAWSVEDEGEGICFDVYCYNIQPGVEIDYRTGESREAAPDRPEGKEETFILNTSSKKFHRPDCSGANSMDEANREEVTCTREELIRQGYAPCGSCKP